MGIVPEVEGRDWVEHMGSSHEAGTFLPRAHTTRSMRSSHDCCAIRANSCMLCDAVVILDDICAHDKMMPKLVF
jgi:hypothetical protein